MSDSLMISLTYLGHNYVFDDIVSNIFGVDNSRHIVTIIDDTYHADIMSGIIESQEFIAFYYYDYYIYFDKTSNILKLGLKMVWNLVRQLYEALPIINYILWHEKSCLIHGAAVEIDGNAYLFLGESGAGKTTFSKLAYERNIHVLSDELIAVQFDDIPIIWGTYVHSNDFNLWEQNIVTRSFPLVACFVLVKSTQSKIAPIFPINKAELFNKFVHKYIYKIYPIEKLLLLIQNLEFYCLEFAKEHFEFNLLNSMRKNKNENLYCQIKYMMNKNPLFWGGIIKTWEDQYNKQIKIVEVIKQKLYFVEIYKSIYRNEFKSCYLIGEYSNIDLKRLVPFLPDVCCFVSCIQINNLPYAGRKKLFSLTKSNDNTKITKSSIHLLKDRNQVDCIKKMVIGRNVEKIPEYEQYIISQIQGISIEILESHDFWGIYNNGNLVSLVRVDNEIIAPNLRVRSIGLVYTKDEHRNKGYAFNLIQIVMMQYGDETNIWRYEAEENNIASCNLAKKLGFIYEGDTFFYEYHST